MKKIFLINESHRNILEAHYRDRAEERLPYDSSKIDDIEWKLNQFLSSKDIWGDYAVDLTPSRTRVKVYAIIRNGRWTTTLTKTIEGLNPAEVNDLLRVDATYDSIDEFIMYKS